MAEETKDHPVTVQDIDREERTEVLAEKSQTLGKQQRRRQRQAETKATIQSKSFKTDQELNEIDQKRQQQKKLQNQRQRHTGPRMNRQEKQVAEQFGLADYPVSKEVESHEVHRSFSAPINQDFMCSEQACNVSCDPEFGKLFEDYQIMAGNADEAGVIMPNLPQEDDAGPIEYKLRLTNLTLEKVRKRTTQMAFRLKEGQGLAFYQIGVHDSGQVIGLSDESIIETLCVVFYMAQYLKAKISLVSVGLAPSGHCLEIKVTKPQPKHMLQPEIDSFLDGLKFLNATRIENQKKKESDSEWFGDEPVQLTHTQEQTNHGPSKSPKSMQTSGFAQQRHQQDDENSVHHSDENDDRQRNQTVPT